MIDKDIAVKLLECNFSILTVGSGKVPNTKWKTYQTEKPTKEELIRNINLSSSNNIGIITGFDNLEVIDVDLKVLPENERDNFWNELMEDINSGLPEISDKLVIYKTKNNGYHIIFKAKNLEGNKKLAVSKHSKEAVIETRGKGGYIFVYSNNAVNNEYCDVEYISNDERDALMDICRSFNYVKIEKPKIDHKPHKKTFEDYNDRVDILTLISDEFKVVGNMRNKTVILRNGAKSKSSGYIFNDINCMYLFTPNTRYEYQRIWSASDVYIEKYHNGNKWDAFIDLNQQGYGDTIEDVDKFMENVNNKKYGITKTIAPEPVVEEKIKFPIDIFPKKMQEFLTDVHDNAGFNIDFLSVAAMSAFATIMGKKLKLKINNAWTTTPIFWFAIVGSPGSKKSHPVKFMLRPLKKLDDISKDVYDVEMAEYNTVNDMENKEKRDYIRMNGKINKPNYKQLIVKDVTIESLFYVHDINHNGILMYKDELMGFISAMGQYKGGKGDDMEKYLSMFDGDDLKINRVTKEPLVMKETNMNMIGTIQPGVLSKIPSENGLLHRFLFTNADNEIKRFSSNEISQKLINMYNNVIHEMHKELSKKGDDIVYEMDDDAKKVFLKIDEYLCNVQNSDETDSITVEYCEKLKTYTPRFALLITAVNHSFNAEENIGYIGKNNMELAFKLVKYFLSTAKKLFLVSNIEKEAFRLTESMNGKTTVEIIKSLNDKKFPVKNIVKVTGKSRQYVHRVLKKSVN